MNGMPPITQTGGSSLSTPERVVTTCQPSQATPASMAAVAAKRTARVDARLRVGTGSTPRTRAARLARMRAKRSFDGSGAGILRRSPFQVIVHSPARGAVFSMLVSAGPRRPLTDPEQQGDFGVPVAFDLLQDEHCAE